MRVLRPLTPRNMSASGRVPRLHVSQWDDTKHSSQPYLLEGIVSSWPAMSLWQPKTLMTRFSTVLFAVGHEGDESITLAQALEGSADPPPYIFDALFADAHPSLLHDYAAPAPFPADGDFLAHLSTFAALRPRWRWLLAGRRGTGIGIHVDPHGTSAWNALVVGSKEWALLPPSAAASVALRGSSDELDDAAALRSAASWFEICAPKLRADATRVGLLECTQEAGDVLFIPAGWWHCARALDAINIGVTHNFLDRRGFLKEEEALIARGVAGIDAARAWRGRLTDAGLLREK